MIWLEKKKKIMYKTEKLKRLASKWQSNLEMHMEDRVWSYLAKYVL